ncbi:DUF3307 domain-containing protein [Glaciecola sp. MH2013]|uniref:DUF3307 domain-containing protein n=1 Tax=Glaciecola sp. MH2013 TaxID=2785524 RepID=UPI00189FAAC1|nr:DUF3307 domain-containing protein [Glaciecola sp. MH2013]MBF7072811.1 DUF3307 domain-containing protein [Glaciecola sp. MH2013]
MTVFLLLLLAHFVADFYLQRHDWIMCKVKNKHRSLGLLKHISVHVVLTSIALFAGGVGLNLSFFIALLVITATHYAIDIWKTYQRFVLSFFLADQAGHFIVIVLVSLWLSGLSVEAIQQSLATFFSNTTLLLLAIYIVACKPISLVISLALDKYTKEFKDEQNASDGLASAGELIGYFERGLIITFILFEHFAGVGFLLAAKSVFRFGDMRRGSDRKLTEYIMLGTLFSFSAAILLGKLGKHFYNTL